MINLLNIQSELSVCPHPLVVNPDCELIIITRGATASLSYNFTDKVYAFNNVDQVTFLFKQNKNLFWYKMFTYLKQTEDITPVEGKTYYTDLVLLRPGHDEFACTAVAVDEPPESLTPGKYYEEVTENSSRRNTLYMQDSHFYQVAGEGYDYLTLTLRPEETLQFEKTRPGTLMDFEIAFRMDTDLYAGSNYSDSIIVEKQHPLAVTDSLYSKLI